MPLIRIEARRGLSTDTKKALMDAVHDALVAAFKIPDSDRTQRFVEYDPDDFDIPPGRSDKYCVVEIAAFSGRSIDAKRTLYQEIVTRFKAAGIPGDDVFILLTEAPTQNWGLRGGQAGCDIDFGFKIDV